MGKGPLSSYITGTGLSVPPEVPRSGDHGEERLGMFGLALDYRLGTGLRTMLNTGEGVDSTANKAD